MSLVGLLLESTVKASLVMLAALIAVACLRTRSAALRHWILSAAIVAATVAPVLGLVMPSWRVPLDAVPRPRLIAMTAPSAVASLPPRSAGETSQPRTAAGVSLARASTLIATTWITGAAVTVLILLIGLGSPGSPPRPAAWRAGDGPPRQRTSRASTGCAARLSSCRAIIPRCSSLGDSSSRR